MSHYIVFFVMLITAFLASWNLPALLGLPVVKPVSTAAPSTEVVSVNDPASTSTEVVSVNDPASTSTNTPVSSTSTSLPTSASSTVNSAVYAGTYDFSIPYYRAVNETTFVEESVKVEDIDPRLAFLTNSAVEEIFYTDDAPVHIINDTEYMAVYRKSYLLENDLSNKRNDAAILYVKKSEIKESIQAATPAEMFLRNRILNDSSSFSIRQMKSENDVYRVDIAYYIIRGIRLVDICNNGGEYGVADILVYIPGKGLMKHGLAVVFFNKKGQNDQFENLYRYNEDIQNTGAEARIATTLFSFANHTDFTQSFNSADWFNNVTELNNADSSWNHKEGQTAYRHASCFANGYEKFLETKGERYTIFLIPEQTSSSGFLNGTVEGSHPITEDEFNAIFDFVGYNPLIGLGESE